MRTSPQDRGMSAFWLLPYMKKPIPTVLNRKPHTSSVMSILLSKQLRNH